MTYAYYRERYERKTTEELREIRFYIEMADHWTNDDWNAVNAIDTILMERKPIEQRKPVESKYKVAKVCRPNASQWFPRNWHGKLAGKTVHFNLKRG